MEPIAMLGFVANIVQLVDAAGKAFSICREIYTLGETVEDARMASTSKHLLDAYDELKMSTNASNSSSGTAGTGDHLILLATQCSQTARVLKGELDSIRKAPGGGLCGTIKTAWLKKRKTKKIDKLKLALDEYQKTLDSRVLIDARQALSDLSVEQEVQGKNFEVQLSRMSSGIKACQSAFADQLRLEIDKYNLASNAQHETTREHVKAAIHDLTLSQKAHVVEQNKQYHSQQQHDQILNSLNFIEMHSRMNNIEESHADTFQWIFEQDATQPWDSFCDWLRDDDAVYWIKGKPGSGKSTLMKFLIDDARTRDLLAQWSSGQQPLIVKFYFSLSGTQMQRSLKGFLCSIVYQILQEDKLLIEKLLYGHPGLLLKRNPGDWSLKELRETFLHSVDLLDCHLCIFLDGLDEFDQDDDVDKLLNLLNVILKSGKAKICASSRPEHYIAKRMAGYKQLRLQDLTASDMEICIRTTLEETRARCRPASISNRYFEWIVEAIVSKADGVFLWVHYALSSLVRGMRKEDTFGDLLRQIDRLPSGMHQLYLQMWNRLNEDKQLYQEQAADYFSYAAESTEERPISLFELLVALYPQWQNIILSGLEPQDPIRLSRDCVALKTHVITRSAGLLEFSTELDIEDGYNLSIASSRSTETTSHKDFGAHSLSDQDDRSLFDSAVDGHVKKIKRINSQNGDLLRVEPSHNGTPLAVHYRSKLKYLHRTARDFLMDTEDGQKLSGNPSGFPVVRSNNILRARMAALVLGFTDFHAIGVVGIMSQIQRNSGQYSHPQDETELVVILRRLCQILSIPGVPHSHIGYPAFWEEDFRDLDAGFVAEGFECAAARKGFAKYIQNFVLDRDSYVDPYCRGLLALSAVTFTRSFEDDFQGKIALFSWLASNGANLRTPQTYEQVRVARSPASEILIRIDRAIPFSDGTDGTLLTHLYNAICALLPYLVSQSWNDIVMLASGKIAKLDGSQSHYVQISVLKLCRLVMEHVESCAPQTLQWSYPDISKEPLTRVVLILGSDTYASHDPSAEWFRPSEVDSLYLGEALEAILFGDSAPHASSVASGKELEAREVEVKKRSSTIKRKQWELEYTTKLEREGKLGNASGLGPERLGDKWFVDTNSSFKLGDGSGKKGN
ncbi:MAG: hypothetical protein L6R36_007688 [Xanthoria steineri]|nr:MAG: hypothetical protein L6R36_007688 [Xanthoria steineri]